MSLEEIEKRLDEIEVSLAELTHEYNQLKHKRTLIRVKELQACREWSHEKCSHLGGGEYVSQV